MNIDLLKDTILFVAKISENTIGLIFFLVVSIIICVLYAFFKIKEKVWDEPHNEILNLKSELRMSELKIEETKKEHQTKIDAIKKRLDNNDDLSVVIKNELVDLLALLDYEEIIYALRNEYQYIRVPKYRDHDRRVQETVMNIFREAIQNNYKYLILTQVFPEMSHLFTNEKVNFNFKNIKDNEIFIELSKFKQHVYTRSEKENKLQEKVDNLTKQLELAKNTNEQYIKMYTELVDSMKSNVAAIPYLAGFIADYETYGLEDLAQKLDWGYDYERLKKVKSIREIRKDAKDMVEKNKEAQYQLAYLLELFPSLQDVIETDFNQLPPIKIEDITDYDKTRDFLSKEEYQTLSVTERNQLALDRYKSSHNKTKWQIGRDYEHYIGYQYHLKGYDVDFFGSYMGLEDLGRDIIAKKEDKTLIIQCKYWSSKKLIHEKHITQLYGTMMSYCIENNCKKSSVYGVLITNITLSPTAKKMAKFLNIKYKENVPAGDYPCIKCNIGRNKDGITKIYHLPFDQKYDDTIISENKGEFYAMTVKEAEDAGFRRAFKWYG